MDLGVYEKPSVFMGFPHINNEKLSPQFYVIVARRDFKVNTLFTGYQSSIQNFLKTFVVFGQRGLSCFPVTLSVLNDVIKQSNSYQFSKENSALPGIYGSFFSGGVF